MSRGHETVVIAEHHPRARPSRSGLFRRCFRVARFPRGRRRAEALAHLLAGRQVAHHKLAVALLRKQRVGQELAVTRKHLALNGSPRIVVAMIQAFAVDCAIAAATIKNGRAT